MVAQHDQEPIIASRSHQDAHNTHCEKALAVLASPALDHDTTVDKEEGQSSRRTGSIITIFGAALANLSDGYQNALASSTNVIIAHLMGRDTFTPTVQTRISNALLVGAVIGILLFGYLADKVSRKGGMLATSGLVVVGSVMATLTFQVEGGATGMLWFLTVARGAAGVGVGGEYPTSAAAALESSNEHFDSKRGPIQVVISTLLATSGSPLCTFIYLMALIGSNDDLKVAFHAMYSISIFLPVFVIFVRWQMQDGKLFERSNFRHRNFPWLLVFRKYWRRIIGTSAAYFLYDFINFPNSIMSGEIINSLVPGKSLRTVALWQVYLALMPVPGILLGAYLVNRVGRRWTGIIGLLFGYALIGFVIGGLYKRLTSHSIAAFVVLYGLLQALGHMGPGATIGLISAEAFPTGVRGVGYGIAAGFGKAGSAVGTEVFTPLRAAAGPESTFYLAAGVGILTSVIYYFLPEGQNTDLAAMDEDFERLVAGEK